MNDIIIHGIPDTLSDDVSAVLRSRLLRAVEEVAQGYEGDGIGIFVGTRRGMARLQERLVASARGGEEATVDERAERYVASRPLWRLDQLVVADSLLDELKTAIGLVRLEPLVFDAWGLRDIEPFPRTALNFHGPPGTGKTMAAHAVASELGVPILVASYAQIESKFHGDGPKNVEAIFHAAAHQGAVLFIDEADSLLSRRLTDVSQGSEQAINSMRSQILICLERFRGVVVFATNLVENYDRAFETRVRHIHFALPDAPARAAIWRRHLPERLPLAPCVNPEQLAGLADELCGRDIKNAVVNAAMAVARRGGAVISHEDLAESVFRIVAARSLVRGGTAPVVEIGHVADLPARIAEAVHGSGGRTDAAVAC